MALRYALLRNAALMAVWKHLKTLLKLTYINLNYLTDSYWNDFNQIYVDQSRNKLCKICIKFTSFFVFV
jgi:hypothetical protein